MAKVNLPFATAYLRQWTQAAEHVRSADLEPIMIALEQVRHKHGTVYVAGNGGSAANAAHMACHLMDVGIKAMCLTDNAPLLTSLANDYQFEDALAMQVGRIWQPQDAICIFSCSGESHNVERLSRMGARPVLAFLGRKHDGISVDTDAVVHVEADHPGVVEDIHSAMIHMVKESLGIDFSVIP